MDSLTSNPISYYVYIQQMDIIQDRNYPNDESANNTFFTFQSIGKNNLDVTSQNQASLTFKVFPQKISITIKYVSFSDVLSKFGIYNSVFLMPSLFQNYSHQ